MKNNSLLSIILLAVLASSASAAASEFQAEPVVLPTFTVNATRLQLAEQRVNTSLGALRAKSGTPAVILLDLPALKTQVTYAATKLTPVRLAKS